MNIVFYESGFWDILYSRKRVERRLKGHEVTFVDGPMNKDNFHLAKKADALAFFVFSKFGKKEFSACKKLKVIATMSTGFDHIDLKLAKRHGVAVCNVPTYGSVTVAEHTLALILAMAKKITGTSNRTKRGRFDLVGLRTFDLEKKTLGLVGFGSIGRNVAVRAKAFSMDIVAYDPYKSSETMESLGVRKVSKQKLFSSSDIISLHTPLFDSTYHIIDKKAIKKMKRGVYIVNTSRGELIDSEALADGLESRKVAGAALDVIENEKGLKNEYKLLRDRGKKYSAMDMRTLVMDHFLINHPNVIFTAHNAFNSKEAVERILMTTVDNIKNYSKGKPQNLVEK